MARFYINSGSPVDDVDEEIGEESDVECDGEENNDLDDDTDEDLNSELDLDLGPDDSIGIGLEWSDRLHDVETELFYAQIVVIQQRAPFIKGHRKEYADWLSAWIKDHKFCQVVILTSTFAQERLDHQLFGSPFRILKSPSMEEKSGEFFKTKMGLQDLESRVSFPAPSLLQQESNPNNLENKLVYMPGSGIAKMLFDNCQSLPVLVLMMFVSEGDNAADGLAIADQLNQWLNLINIQIKCSAAKERNEFIKCGNHGRIKSKDRTTLMEDKPGLLRRSVVLQHDNATPHSANLTQQWLQRYGWEILPHLAHSPDLAPSDFHLFGPLKRHLGGMAFETEDDLIMN
ncbi:proteasome assembly chaperone 2 [Plakobranchus ocellatus]|uniref:Proteasome assembly chaperone 2 n=1 Tax=Plakobranchus ocellatus TaxID=259542 RepID=A0AAV4DHC1_9GAST|nr:proteasome assembly chaperone 2 [Plakobranchus ocellatus]